MYIYHFICSKLIPSYFPKLEFEADLSKSYTHTQLNTYH